MHKFVKYFPINENVVEVNVLNVPYFQLLLNHQLMNINVSMLVLEQDTKLKFLFSIKQTNKNQILLHQLFDEIEVKQ